MSGSTRRSPALERAVARLEATCAAVAAQSRPLRKTAAESDRAKQLLGAVLGKRVAEMARALDKRRRGEGAE